MMFYSFQISNYDKKGKTTAKVCNKINFLLIKSVIVLKNINDTIVFKAASIKKKRSPDLIILSNELPKELTTFKVCQEGDAISG